MQTGSTPYEYPDYIDPYSYAWDIYPGVNSGNAYDYEKVYRDQQKHSPYGDLSTDSWNLYKMERQNYLNMAQWQAQNAFNLDMWNLNNDYNSPSAQMDRLIQAGINPVYALGSSASGNAQALGAGDPNGVTPIASTGVDRALDQDYAKFVQSNSLNATLGLGKLNIEQQKADIAAKVGDSEAVKNEKQADYLKFLAEGQRISNDWDLESFDVRLDEEASKLKSIDAQIAELKSRKDLNEEQIKELQSLEDKYGAEADLARERINDIKASIRQRDEQLRIGWFNAYSNRISSNAQSSQAETFKAQLELNEQRLSAEIQKWNNDQLFEYMRTFGRNFQIKGKGRLGTKFNYVEGSGSWSGLYPAEDYPLKPIVVCNEVINRASENPSPESLRAAAEADRIMKALAKAYNLKNKIFEKPSDDYLHFTPDATSVANPVYGMDDGSW